MELRFFRIWLLSALGLTTLFVLFCYVVDPFGVFLKWRIPGFNQAKFCLPDYSRITAPYQTFTHRPDGVILGSSRAEVSLDPAHPALAAHANKTLNLGLSGAAVYESYRNLLHAHSVNPLSLAVVGLDSGNFFPFSFKMRTGMEFVDGRFLKGKPDFAGYFFTRLARETLLSLTAFRASVDTILSQEEWPAYQFGFDGPGWTRIKDGNRRKMGLRQMFLKEESRILLRKPVKKDSLFWEKFFQGKTEPFNHLREIIRLCRKNNIQLVLLLHPTHAREQEANRVLGDWPDLERLKRTLVTLIAEEEKRTPGMDIVLWDFSGYNSVTTEPLPPLGDKNTEMTYYLEASHNTIHAGNLMIDRMFGYEHPGRKVPGDFGVRLTTDNIESRLKITRQRQREYGKTHPEDVREIEDAWRRIKALHKN